MAENRAGDGERPTLEQPAPVREAPTLAGPPDDDPLSVVPPPLPPAALAPGAPPPLPPVPMDTVEGVAPVTVVLIAVLAALAGATVTAVLFLLLG